MLLPLLGFVMPGLGTALPKMFAMDGFAMRQFNNPSYVGTQISFDVQQFEDRVNEEYVSRGLSLVEGYAPFCKHLFLPNFAGVACGYAVKGPEVSQLIRSCYESRSPEELPVLVEFVHRSDFDPPQATHLDVILYSREQLIQENLAMGVQPPEPDSSPWRIISVKGQLCDYELPMQPITIMRNALGKSEGGSGVPLDRAKYLASVDFWSKHVAIK